MDSDESIRQKIVDFLKDKPHGASSSEIRDEMRLNRTTVTKYLEVLRHQGAVQYKNIGMAKLWYIAESPTLAMLSDEKNPVCQTLDLIGDLIEVIGRDFRVIWVNKTYCDMAKAERAEIIGKKCFETFYGQNKVCGECPAAKTFETGDISRYMRNIRRNGKEIFLDSLSYAVKDKDGNVMAVVIVSRDVTEMKRAQQRIRYLADLLEHVNDGVRSTDLSGKIKSWNRASERIYGWKREEVLGKDSGILYPEDQLHVRDKVIKEANEHGQWFGKVVQKRKDGSLINVYFSIAKIMDAEGRQVGLVGIVNDVDERKRMEERLRKLS